MPTSRWVKIVGRVATAPLGMWVNEPPAEASATVPSGSTRSRPRRQPSSRPVVRNWIGVGGTVSKSPIIATPQVFWLKPPVWAPSTGRVDAACPAFEDLAVLVDERVVGDVAPAKRAGVVLVDRSDDACRVLRLRSRCCPRCGGRLPARTPLSYTVVPHFIDSSAPHCARPMMLGAWPGAVTAAGGSHCASTGACGGLIRTALRFCANGCSALAGHVAEPGPGGGRGRRSGRGTPGGPVTEIWTAVVRPTKTGSVPRGPAVSVADAVERLGLVPGAPGAVGLLGADPCRRAGQVRRRERHHGERRVLVYFADGLAAADAGEGPFDDQRCGGLRLIAIGRAPRRTPTATSPRLPRTAENSSDGSVAAGQHGLMLRMGQLLPEFRHGLRYPGMSTAQTRNGTAEPTPASAVPFRCRTRYAGAAAAAAGAAAAAAGTPRLDGARDRGHHHALEQIDRLARRRASGRRWTGRPANLHCRCSPVRRGRGRGHHRGSGRCPPRDRARSGRRSGSRRGRPGRST